MERSRYPVNRWHIAAMVSLCSPTHPYALADPAERCRHAPGPKGDARISQLTFSSSAAYSRTVQTEPVIVQGIGILRYHFQDYVFDTDRRELRRGVEVVSIAPQVFDLLDYLIRNRERVVSKDDLINAIWKGRSVSDAALTTRLNVVRTAIGDSGEGQRLIKTLPRKGFRFVGHVQEAEIPADEAAANCLVQSPKQVLALPDKPSIAVLPFQNMSGDQEQDYFADGMSENIITRIVAVQVAVRHSPQFELHL